MGIFNEFYKKEKPFFTGIARGFGFGGGGGGGGGAQLQLCRQWRNKIYIKWL